MTQPNWTEKKSEQCNQRTKIYKITRRKDNDKARTSRSKKTNVSSISKNTQVRKPMEAINKFRYL